MTELCDVGVIVNGEHSFYVNQRLISTFSGKVRKIIREDKKKTSQLGDSEIEINEFPGGADGFELVLKFCYNNGRIQINSSNISVLHSSALFLEMTENFFTSNLIAQTESFLEGVFYWSWSDLVASIQACGSFLHFAQSSGLLQKLISCLIAKMTVNSDSVVTASSSSSSSSPEVFGFRSSSSKKIPEKLKVSTHKAWWFDDLTIFPPKIVQVIIEAMAESDATNPILTRFLLHYLKSKIRTRSNFLRSEFGVLADIAVNGVVSMGKTDFSCRGLFWVLRVVSGFGLSKDRIIRLERLIGGMLDQATLDDLLVTGHDGGVYDVNLVSRLVRVFVSESDGLTSQKLKKLGRLIDKYMREISPDQNLKVSKFLWVAESLPDAARDCFDGLYRAVDIYLESHPGLSLEDRTKVCRCLNYEKLTLEACKDLAKNPRIPPRVAIQALASQKSQVQMEIQTVTEDCNWDAKEISPEFSREKEEMQINLQRMQSRVIELEKTCREMKGQMIKMVKNRFINPSPSPDRSGIPKLC